MHSQKYKKCFEQCFSQLTTSYVIYFAEKRFVQGLHSEDSN